jgi:hypothetical protein
MSTKSMRSALIGRGDRFSERDMRKLPRMSRKGGARFSEQDVRKLPRMSRKSGDRFSEQDMRKLKVHDDLAEHLTVFHPLQGARDVGQRHLGVDHRRHALRHLLKAFGDVLQGAGERADDAILPLE